MEIDSLQEVTKLNLKSNVINTFSDTTDFENLLEQDEKEYCPKISNKNFPEMSIFQILKFLTYSSIMFLILSLIPYLAKELFQFALGCGHSTQWSEVIYTNRDFPNCIEKCYHLNGKTEEVLLKMPYYFCRFLNNCYLGYLLFHTKHHKTLFIYYIAVLGISTGSLFIGAWPIYYHHMFTDLGYALGIIVTGYMHSKEMLYLSLALCVINVFVLTFLHEVYEYVYFKLIKINENLFITILPFNISLNSLYASLIIRQSIFSKFHPLLKFYFGFTVLAYLKGVSFGMMMNLLFNQGIGSAHLWISLTISIISEQLDLFGIIGKLFYMVINLCLKTKRKENAPNDFQIILHSCYPFINILCIVMLCFTVFTNTFLINYSPGDINDCYGNINKKFFSGSLLSLLFGVVIISAKVALFYCINYYLRKTQFKEHKLYYPSVQNHYMFYMIVGFNMQLIIRGLYVGLIIKH